MKKWLIALLFSGAAHGNTFMSNFQDLWWNANESGWGVTITHQREVIFLTFFVYGPDGRARWYTGQASFVNNTSQGAAIFSGQMIEATGPWFAVAFNPSLVSARLVGTVTFTAFLDSATLSYTIDGTTVNKTVTRQTFRNDELTGNYTGQLRQTQSACTFPTPSGTFINAGDITISQTGTNFTMTIRTTSDLCTYAGTYNQTGSLGLLQNGNYACNSGLRGTFNLLEVAATLSSVSGRYSASNNVCTTVTGRFAAVRN